MYINASELTARLEGQIITKDKPRRGKAIDSSVRELAGLLSNAGGNQAEISRDLGISQSHVSQASFGLVNSRFDKELHEKVTQPVIDRNKAIKERAMDALANMVEQVANTSGGLSPDKASRIAVDMARISSSLSGAGDINGGSKALIIIAPGRNEEASYKRIKDIEVKGNDD